MDTPDLLQRKKRQSMAQSTGETQLSTKLLVQRQECMSATIKQLDSGLHRSSLSYKELLTTRLKSTSTFWMALITLPLLIALLALTGDFTNAWPARKSTCQTTKCTISTFAGILPREASVEKIASVPQNGTYGEGEANMGYPTNATGLPELCAVTVKVTSSSTSSYRFGLFLPISSSWNSRFLAVGNGAFLGGINWVGSKCI